MKAPLEVGLCCRDLMTMRHFYQDVLGFTFISELVSPAEVAVRLGLCSGSYRVVRLQTPYGERLKLLAPDNPPALGEVSSFVLDRQGATYLTLIVDDVAELALRLSKVDVKFLADSRAIEIRPGIQVLFCRDPEGNVVELVQYDDLSQYRRRLNPE